MTKSELLIALDRLPETDPRLEHVATTLNGEENERLLVTQSDAARMLSLSRVTIYRLVKAGELHPVMVRGARRTRTR